MTKRSILYKRKTYIKFDYVNSHFKILYSSLLFLNFKKLSLKFLSRSLGHLPASFLLTVLIMLPSPFHCIHTKRISVPRFASRPFRMLPTPQSTGPLAYFLAHFHTLEASGRPSLPLQMKFALHPCQMLTTVTALACLALPFVFRFKHSSGSFTTTTLTTFPTKTFTLLNGQQACSHHWVNPTCSFCPKCLLPSPSYLFS